MLSMLKELPQAHHSRIEWLTKRPTIQHVGIEDLRLELFNTEEHKRNQRQISKVKKKSSIFGKFYR